MSVGRGRRSRLLLAAAVAAVLLAAGYLLLRGREAGGPVAPATMAAVPRVAAATTAGRRVIFVGLDGADWQLLDEYMARGWMPNLQTLVREGRRGVLLTEEPILSPLLWTTMFTGSSPLEHRILDFAHFHPLSGDRELISSSERRRPAIWNMASYGGKSVAVFGQWATYPAEPVNGVMVSDRLFTFLYQEESPPPRIVHPPALEAWARRTLGEVEEQIDSAALRAFLPWLDAAAAAEIERQGRSYENPVSALRRILVETQLYHRLATEHIARHRPDLTMLYIQGTDSIGHVFAPFAPPRQANVSERDYERYHRVPERFFRAVDDLLGEYRRLARELGAVLVLASDHGFLWREGRPTLASSQDTETAAQWHRTEGMYVVWGAGPAPSENAAGAGIRQVCATLLALLGLPDGAAVQGPPLAGIPGSEAPADDYRRIYEPVAPAPAAGSTENSDQELAKLRDLGYLGGRDASVSRPAGEDSTLTAGAHTNEGLILMGLRRYDEAEAALRRALALDPERTATLVNLGILLVESGRIEEALEQLRAAVRAEPEASHPRLNLATALQRAERWPEAIAQYDAILESSPGDPQASFLRATGLFRAGRFDEAIAGFDAVLEAMPAYPEAALLRATALLRSGRRSQGSEALRSLLADREGGLEARVELANDLARLGELQEALGVLGEGSGRNDPPAARARAQVEAARLLLSAGRAEEALPRLAEAARLEGAPPDLEAVRGEALAAVGRHREAAAAYRAAVERLPTNPQLRVAEATALVRTGDWARARARLEEGLGRLPQSANLAHVLARLLVTAPDPELRDGQRALELANGVFRARDSLEHGETVAMALAESGRFEEAAAFQQRLLDRVRQAGEAELARRLESNLSRYRRREAVASSSS